MILLVRNVLQELIPLTLEPLFALNAVVDQKLILTALLVNYVTQDHSVLMTANAKNAQKTKFLTLLEAADVMLVVLVLNQTAIRLYALNALLVNSLLLMELANFVL